MWTNTSVTARLGLRYPIIQGPFGGSFSTVRLAATVSNHGGLGSFGAQAFPAREIRRIISEIRSQTDRPFAVNLWVSDRDPVNYSTIHRQVHERLAAWQPYFRELGVPEPTYPMPSGESFEQQVEAVLEERPPAFSFVFGIPPADILRECRRRGILTIGAATTVEEAVAQEEAGVDMVVASGSEAGGHRPSFLKRAEDSLIGTLSLVPQVVDAVRIPVIAAGGIADGRGVAAALALGAGAAQLGTAFLACEESGAAPFHRTKLRDGSARGTVLTRTYTGRLARFIRNRFIEETDRHEVPPLPFPWQSWAAAGLKQAATDQQREDLAPLYAGQGAGLTRETSAASLMATLVEQMNSFSPSFAFTHA